MIFSDWTEYTRQVLNFAGHGYVYFCPISIPQKKMDKVEQIDKKIIEKYPMCEWGKDKRYRAKKMGMANFVYLRWATNGIIMHTTGNVPEIKDPDRWNHLDQATYELPVGPWIKIKIGKARTGKKYTAYLTKRSYRSVKAVLRENIDHRRFDEFEKYYYRLEALPAFSGIVSQMGELYRFFRAEIKKKRVSMDLRPLVLKRIY